MFFSSTESNQNELKNELTKLNQVGESYAHEKTQTSANIIQKSEPIRLGDLSNIQRTETAEKKTQKGKSITEWS